jgi:WD40 repeat protein
MTCSSSCGLSSVNSGSCVRTFVPEAGYIWCISFSPDGQFVAFGTAKETIEIICVSEAAFENSSLTSSSFEGQITSVAYSSNGECLATGSADKSIRIWSTLLGTSCCKLIGHTDNVTGLVFSPDNRYLASCSSDCSLKVWSVARGNCVRTLIEQSYFLNHPSFSPDGQYFGGITR